MTGAPVEDRIIQNVVVLGGGTAGWLTAIYAKHNLPSKSVTVIESESIGILGAGEGATPHLISLLDGLGIALSTLVKETKSTIKNGIKFTNWNGGGSEDFYYHPFFADSEMNLERSCASPYVSSAPSILTSAIEIDKSLKQSDFILNISERNKVPFVYSEDLEAEGQNQLLNYYNLSNYSIHFDASELANSLKKIALDRGVLLVEGVVEGVDQDDTGDIKNLILDSGAIVNSDFIFDCSGFHRFFPNFFDSKWKSYSEYLPVDTALPFFLPIDEDNIPPYTEAIAMKYGWMWKIPLQHRYGCGYVFDSSFIDESEAKKEVEDYLGHSIESPKTIKFSPGYYETPWVNNVVSLGLSGGFIEPLEATSIWVSIIYMKEILANPEVMYKRDPRFTNDYNSYVTRVNEEVFKFVYFHYMTSRVDTDFWKKFTRESAPESLSNLLDIMDYRLLKPRDLEVNNAIWDVFSWYKIAFGINYPKLYEFVDDAIFYNQFRSFFKSVYLRYKAAQEEYSVIYCSTHTDFLNSLKD